MWICCTFIKKLLNKFYINRRDLLVVTAQILLNALRDGIVSVTDFSLMVFDECHHTNDNHSYNMIMNQYLDIKLQDRERAKTLPMVLYQSFYNIYYCWLKIEKYIVLMLIHLQLYYSAISFWYFHLPVYFLDFQDLLA